ncbi:MAG: hypothetical protein ABIR59_13785 [Gemmatimonadales bacterium]
MTASTREPPVAPQQELSAHWTRRDWLFVAGVIGLAIVLGWLARAQEIGVDEATQIALAKSITSGHYRDEYLVGHPVHAQYPPLMSVWFLIVQFFVGPSLDAVRAVNLILHAASAMLIGDSLRRLGWRALGVASLAVIVLNPALLVLAGSVRSETLYVALTSVALWSSVRLQRPSSRQGLCTVLAVGAAFLTRTAGISIVGAMGLVMAQRHRRFAVGLAVSLVAIVGTWFFFSFGRGAGGGGASYANDLSFVASTPGAFLRHAGLALFEYSIRTPFMQFGLPNLPTKLDTLVAGIGIPVLTAIGMIRVAKAWPLAAANLILAMAVVMVWPWTDGRFLTPLVPSIVAMMLVGTATFATRFLGAKAEKAALAVAMFFALAGAATAVRAASTGQRCRIDPEAIANPKCNHAESRAIAPASRFLRDSVPRGAVIATQKNALVNYISGHQTVVSFDRAPDGQLAFLAPGSGVDYLILATQGVAVDSDVVDDLLSACGSLSVVREFAFGTIVLAPRRSADTRPSACALLEAIVP